MSSLPITHMTLYKHGVGYYVRRASLSGETVRLAFRVEEMNDILKSLTALDRQGGQVLGIDYPTPQSQEERLAGCSIRLADDRSLRDLLVGLRGRRVRLWLGNPSPDVAGEAPGAPEASHAEAAGNFAAGNIAAGTLVGLDEPSAEQPLAGGLVSLLVADTTRVLTVGLARVQGVEILDEQGAGDLRFFLETALGQDKFRQVTVRLTPGDHDLQVSYIAPAPTWRVSYRLVLDQIDDETALLLGWGIFDNRLEEDLSDISLSLVAGMPLSFVYDLVTPFTPERPEIEPESRVAPGPVEFGARLGAVPAATAVAAPMAAAPQAMEAELRMKDVMQSTAVTASGQDRAELFQYDIRTPVSVGRGQSAMVPIVGAELACHRDLLFNEAKLPGHPVATLRLNNQTGLTLERGPVTVLAANQYVGEAILPFTTTGAELAVPYAVELGISIQVSRQAGQQTHALALSGAYLRLEEWHIQRTRYQINSNVDRPVTVLIEHPRRRGLELFDTPEPVERTADQLRFAVPAAARAEMSLLVQERQLRRRQERLDKQSYSGLQRYLQAGLIDRHQHEALVRLLQLWEMLAQRQEALEQFETRRGRIEQTQKGIRENIQALDPKGKEGSMRQAYVDRLAETEAQLRALEAEEATAEAEIKRFEAEVEAMLASFAAEAED